MMRDAKQLNNTRQLLGVQFGNVGELQGLGEHFRRVECLAKIHVEDSCRPGTRRSQKFMDCFARRRGTLGERAEADRIRLLGE